MRQVAFLMLFATVPLFAQENTPPAPPEEPPTLDVSTEKPQLQALVEKQLGEPTQYQLVRHLLEGHKLRDYFEGCPSRLINGCGKTGDLISCLEGVADRVDASNVDCGELLELNIRTLKIISGRMDPTDTTTRARRPTSPSRTRAGT